MLIYFFFFFKSGSSGKPRRSWPNAGVCMEEIVAYRAFGVAETFLGHQVNASTATCFTCSLNYILLPLGPTETTSNHQSKWESIREILIEDRMQCDAYRVFGVRTSIYRVTKAARYDFDRFLNHINKSFFLLARESNVEWCPTCTTLLFLMIDRSVNSESIFPQEKYRGINNFSSNN